MEEQYKDVARLVKEAELDTPSSDFLHNVMKHIEIADAKKTYTYRPLISKKTWFVIGLHILAIVFGLTFMSKPETSIFNPIDFSFLNSIKIENPFSRFVLSKATIYGFLFLGILFFVQVNFLKKIIDRRFSV